MCDDAAIKRPREGNHRMEKGSHVRHAELTSSSGETLTFSELRKLRTHHAAKGAKVPANRVGSLEIYARFPFQYDTLMGYHDCSALRAEIEHAASALAAARGDGGSGGVGGGAAPLTLLDIGCGTGRIARLLQGSPAAPARIAGYDKYGPMLLVMDTFFPAECARFDVAVEGAAPFSWTSSTPAQPALCLRPASYECLFGAESVLRSGHWKCDLIVMAWSLSYVMRANWGNDAWKTNVDALLQRVISHTIDPARGGAIIVVETLGTGSPQPTRRLALTEYLVAQWGFECACASSNGFIRTDYRFPTLDEGKALTNFFFASKQSVEETPTGPALVECTGVWVRIIPPQKPEISS